MALKHLFFKAPAQVETKLGIIGKQLPPDLVGLMHILTFKHQQPKAFTPPDNNAVVPASVRLPLEKLRLHATVVYPMFTSTD